MDTISIRNHVFAHVIFGFYQRGVLFPLSMITNANMNCSLCPAVKDPVEPLIGKWYYLVAEIYIFINGEIFHQLVKLILNFTIRVKNYIIKRKVRLD
jgi:hypothetical protein